MVPREMYDALLRENQEQRQQLAALVDQVARLTLLQADANDRIRELVALVERKARPTPSKTPAPPAPANVSEDVRKAYNERPKADPRPKRKRQSNKRPKPTGRKPIPDHLEAEEHHVAPDACQECGCKDLEKVDEIVETKLHTVEQHQRRRIVRRVTACCKHCGTRTTARSLPSPFNRSKATCEWIAWLLHQKCVMLAPLDRIRRDLAAKGIPLSISYMVDQIKRASDLLDCVDGQHWKELLAGDWMATDATGLKVLLPGLPGSHNGYIEVFRRDDLVVFQYEATKDAETLASKLAPFNGTLVADAEHRYNATYVDGTVLEAGCNAHGRRKFRDVEAVQPALAKEGGDFIANMYVQEDAAKKRGLQGDELKAWRQTMIGPIRDKLLDWMDAVEPTLLPDDPLAKVISYYRNHWEALFRFIDNPNIPIDNSASEREFQHVAKFRLNSLFAGSTEGAHRAAVLLGISATCRALGIDAQAYFAWALTRLGTHRDVYALSAAELTPAAYARTLTD